MKTIDGYVCKKINGEPCLVPYGQAIASMTPGVRLNDTSLYFYNTILEAKSEDDAFRVVQAHFGADTPGLKSDFYRFVEYLKSYGILHSRPIGNEVACARFLIAGIHIAYFGDEALISKELKAFADEDENAGADLRVYCVKAKPKTYTTGNVLIRTDELMVTEDETDISVVYFSGAAVRELHIDKETFAAYIYVSDDEVKKEAEYTPAEEVFFAMRTAFLYLASKRGMFAMHSVSLLYRDKLWLISASSGTGKTTHAKLWEENYGVRIINGDLNLIRIDGDEAKVPGIPWCGTSNIYENNEYPLGGIVLLRRADKDSVKRMTGDGAALGLSNRLISPAWTKELLERNLSFAYELCERVAVMKLKATMERTSATTLKTAIDELY